MSAYAKSGDKGNECDFEKTVLSPAANNPCFQKLLPKAINSEDRKWLMQLSKTWNPDPSLKVVMVPGGIIVFKNNKKILDARWIFSSPLVLAWNDRVIVSNGDVKTKSLKKFFDELIDQSSSHASNFSLILPSAFAAEPSDDAVAKDLFTLYTFNYSDKLDAQKLIEEFKKSPGLFPALSFMERNWSGKDLNCTKQGDMDSVTYDFNTDNWLRNKLAGRPQTKPVVIKAKSPTSLIIKGMFGDNGEKTVLAEYQPVSHLSDDKTRVYDAQHWVGGGENISATGVKTPNWKFKYYVCDDANCQTKTQVQDYDALEKLAKPNLRGEVPLDIERALLGSSVLSACCKSDSCRKVAADAISINLKTPEGSATTK